MQEIINLLVRKYDPECLILYGSYADGSCNANSDFDAMLLADVSEVTHDVSLVGEVQLDVFVYPADTEICPEDNPQLYHSKVLIDRKGRGTKLCDAVKAYIDQYIPKSQEDIRNDIVWCEKMLSRTERGDAEGFYRWHWVLCDSLEFYCNIRGQFYFGPKKALRWMQQQDSNAYAIYSAALQSMEHECLVRWVEFLKNELLG